MASDSANESARLAVGALEQAQEHADIVINAKIVQSSGFASPPDWSIDLKFGQ